MSIQICVVTHTPLASALREVMAHIMGERGTLNALWFDVTADEATHATCLRIQAAVSEKKINDILFLTDLPHATPHNCAQQVANALNANAYSCGVISSCTVPMLVRAISNTQLTLTELIEKLSQ